MKTHGPDGFHSWVVAAGCCLLYLLMYGMSRISGLLFVETMSLFNVQREDASFPYVFAVTMRYVSGPLSGLLARRIGIRYVIILGCLMGFVGVGGCYFASNIVVVTVLWGVIHGMGAGFATCILPQVVNLYFKKHTTKVYGLTYAGSSLSGFVLTPIAEFLLNTYGLSGTYLILCGMILNGLAAAILLKKPDFQITTSEPETHTTFGNNSTKEYETSDAVVCLGYRVIPYYSLMKTNTSDTNNERRKTIDISVINQLKDNVDLDVKINVVPENGVKLRHEPKHEYIGISLDNKNGNLFSKNILLSSASNGKTTDTKSNSSHILDPSMLSSAADIDEISPISQKDNNPEYYETVKRRNGIAISKENNIYSKNGVSPNDNSLEIPQTNAVFEKKDKKKSWLHDLSVFKDPVYFCLCIGEALSSFLFVVTPTILVDYGLDKGIPVEYSAYLLMAFSVCDMTGSIVLGWIIDTNFLSKTNFTAVCFCVSAASFVLLAFSTSYTMMTFGVILEGLSLGSLAPIFPGIIGEYIDSTQQTVAISSIGFLYVPLSFATSPLIGFFRDDIGSYVYMFYLMCGISIICCLLFLCMPAIAKCRNRS